MQPDEDDYGYVSHEASEYYRKLMNKYNSGPSTDSGSKQSGKTRRELLNTKVSHSMSHSILYYLY